VRSMIAAFSATMPPSTRAPGPNGGPSPAARSSRRRGSPKERWP
jgi:hypothetical protein